jgi:hypothetical protein
MYIYYSDSLIPYTTTTAQQYGGRSYSIKYGTL